MTDWNSMSEEEFTAVYSERQRAYIKALYDGTDYHEAQEAFREVQDVYLRTCGFERPKDASLR